MINFQLQSGIHEIVLKYRLGMEQDLHY